MTNLILRNILEKIDYNACYTGNENSIFSSVSFDSRQIQPGHIFVAIKGLQYDGHRYIEEALNNGAGLIVVENEPAEKCPVSWIKVPDSRLALAQLAAEFFRHPSRELSLTGVTGTCGKTTTTGILHHIYATAALNAGLIGTVDIRCGSKTWPAKLTTPDAMEVQRLLRLMNDNGVSHAAMEVSSHSLAQKRVDGVNFRGAIFTNISPNHLDYHLDMEEYVRTKKRLAFLVESGGFILVNGHDPYFRTIKDYDSSTVFLLGEHNDFDITIGNVSSGKRGSTFDLNINNRDLQEKLMIEGRLLRLGTTLPGRHNIFNGAAAAVSALLTGVDEKSISRGLASFQGVKRRMQVVQVNGLQIIDDTAMNPGSIDAVFNALNDLAITRLVVVYAIRGCRGVRVNEDNGRSLARWIKQLKVDNFFSTCSISHVDEQNRVLPAEEDAFLMGSLSEGIVAKHFPELPEALTGALEVVSPGTTLLLLGAQGMDEGVDLVRARLEKDKGLAAPAASTFS